MLANGAKLGYSTSEGSGTITYTDIPGLKEIPEIGVDPEKVENTCLTDSVKKFEQGIGDPGDMAFIFKWDTSTSANKTAYNAMKTAQEAGSVVHFKEELKDGTTVTFDGQPAVKISGGGVNGVIEWTLSVALQSDLTITLPA